jgi:hypothetical protein
MAFNFPASANVGDIYNSGSFSFQFDGVAWNYVNTIAVLAFNQANAAYAKANSSAQITFGTIIANGTSIVASSTNDTLTIIPNANVSIVGNSTTKNITFDLTDTAVVSTTYGGNTIVPVFVVDSKGRLTSVTNTSIDMSTTTSAFNQANTANLNAFAANRTANSAQIHANAAFVHANAAFLQANNANVYAFGAHRTANSAQVHANAAFLQANQVGGAVSTANGALTTANTNMVFKTGNTMTGNLVMSGANIAFATATNSGIYWSGTSFIYSSAANTLIFGTASAEDVRIDASGNVGIRTFSPIAALDVSGSFSVAKANALNQTLTDGATINWDTSLGQVATVTLSGNRILNNATNLRVGTYILHVIQDGVGGRTLSFQRGYKFTANVIPTLTSAAGSRDMFSFVSDGTNLYGAFIPDVRS